MEFVTFFKPQTTLTGRLESLVDIISWPLDENPPRTTTIRLRRRIPTKLLRTMNQSVFASVEKLKEEVHTFYSLELEKIRDKIVACKPQTKKYIQLKEKEKALESFLENISTIIKTEGPFKLGNCQVYHLLAPNIPSEFIDIHLSEDFIKNKYSNYNRQIALALDFPFGIIDRGHILKERVSLESLLQKPALAIDFETTNWRRIRLQGQISLSDDEPKQQIINLTQIHNLKFDIRALDSMSRAQYERCLEEIVNQTKEEKVTVASLVDLTSSNSYVITTFNPKFDEIKVHIPGTSDSRRVIVIQAPDQYHLQHHFNSLIAQINPLFVYGHNQMGFDYRTIQRLTGNFNAGVNARQPLHVSQATPGFLFQTILPGRIDIDPQPYAFYYMNCRNTKLDTVFQHVFGIKSPKTLSEVGLEEKTSLAEQGDQQAIFDVLYYAVQDAMKSFLIGEKLKREHLLLACLHNSLPARIDSVSPKSLSEDYWVNYLWKRKHTFPSYDIMTTQASFKNGQTEAQLKFEDFSCDNILLDLFRDFEITPGLYNGTLITVFPFSHAFADLLARDPNVRSILARVKETRDPKEKVRLLKSLESLAEYPLFRTLDVNLPENIYAAEFSLGFSGIEQEKYRRKINKNLEAILNLFGKTGPVNLSRGYLVAPSSVDHKMLEYLGSRDILVNLGRGLFLSGTRGRFAANVNDELLMMGILDYQANRPSRCEFEKKFYEEFLDKILLEHDSRGALIYLNDISTSLTKGQVPQEELPFEAIARRDHTDFSIRARQKYIEIMTKRKAKKGDLVKEQYDLPTMQRKFFGVNFDEVAPEVEQQYELGLESSKNPTYKHSEGTISEIVSWTFGSKLANQAKIRLNRIYLGQGTIDDVDYLVELAQS